MADTIRAAEAINRFGAVAKIAKVDEKYIPAFCRCIEHLVSELSPTGKLGNASIAELRNQLKRIGAASESLRNKVGGIEYYINAMLLDAGNDSDTEQLVECLKKFEKAVLAAEQDAKQLAKRGRPSGLRNAFDAFVYRLIRNAHLYHGRLTIYKSQYKSDDDDDGWRGSLLDAINMLKPQLPPDCLPERNLGYTLNRIAEQAGRNQRKSSETF